MYAAAGFLRRTRRLAPSAVGDLSLEIDAIHLAKFWIVIEWNFEVVQIWGVPDSIRII